MSWEETQRQFESFAREIIHISAKCCVRCIARCWRRTGGAASAVG